MTEVEQGLCPEAIRGATRTTVSVDLEGLTKLGIALALTSFAAVDGIVNAALGRSYLNLFWDVAALFVAHEVGKGRKITFEFLRWPLRDSLGKTPSAIDS